MSRWAVVIHTYVYDLYFIKIIGYLQPTICTTILLHVRNIIINYYWTMLITPIVINIYIFFPTT